MNIFPLEIEEIILNYKAQLEHTTKFKKIIKTIKKYDYKIINEDFSVREDQFGEVYYKRYLYNSFCSWNEIGVSIHIHEYFDKFIFIYDDGEEEETNRNTPERIIMLK